MLHILLGLLKIIGILLAVILGIILLVILVVLFAALRYEVTATADNDIKSLNAYVRFSWLFRLISGYVKYQEEKVEWQMRIAWKKLNVPKEENSHPVNVDVKEIAKDVTEDTKDIAKEITTEVVNEVKESASHNQTETVKAEKKAKKAKKKTKKKIGCSFQKISDKIKEITDLKDKIVAFLTAETHKKAFQKLLKELLRLLKKLKPKKLKANVEYGFEDPYKTGSILAYLSMLYPFYGDNIHIVPHFKEKVIKGDIFIKGRIRISYMANMGIRLILDKHIRLTIKEIMKLIAKK